MVASNLAFDEPIAIDLIYILPKQVNIFDLRSMPVRDREIHDWEKKSLIIFNSPDLDIEDAYRNLQDTYLTVNWQADRTIAVVAPVIEPSVSYRWEGDLPILSPLPVRRFFDSLLPNIKKLQTETSLELFN
jgi:hypothetical protein